MSEFKNKATLSYGGNVTNSNTVKGELVSYLTATKTAVIDRYAFGDRVTYIISIVNSGNEEYSDIAIKDDLGAYQFGADKLVPLDYVPNSLQYYMNGSLRSTPQVEVDSTLNISNIVIPTRGNAIIVYEASANEFASLETDGTITNTALISSNGITLPITVTETIFAEQKPQLSITKAMSPSTIVENGIVTYTFTIQNTGNIAATLDDDIVLTDIFHPILNPITVKFNEIDWTEVTDYTYDETIGEFKAKVTVPAATFMQDPVEGNWIITPGVSVLTITGTV